MLGSSLAGLAGNTVFLDSDSVILANARGRLADETGVISIAPEPDVLVQFQYMSQELYSITSEGRATIVELALPPSLDSEEFDELNDSLLKLIGGQPAGRWVLDLSRLSYLGSAALGLMVNLRQQVKDAGGMLVLCGMSPRLANIFRTCCMERLFLIKPNRVEALRSVMN